MIRTLPFSLLESPTVTAKASPCPMQTTGGNRHLNLQSLLRAAYLFGFARDGWCKLCRLLLTFALLSLLFGSRAMASNPQDLAFQLRFVKETPAYHHGESILLEIWYSSSAKDKYQRSSNSALQGIKIHIVPTDGVLDLNVLRFEHGWAGSIIGGMGVLSSQSTTQQIDLCSLYRLEKAGHYSVYITSNEVSRIKTAEEGGGLEHLTLESNEIEFDILPPDPAWAAAELNSIQSELNSAEPGAADRAIGRLGRLDTVASIRKLLHLYLLRTETAGPEWLVASTLRESSQLEVIIPAFLSLKRRFRIHQQRSHLRCRKSWPTFKPGKISAFCQLTQRMTRASPSGMQKQNDGRIFTRNTSNRPTLFS